MGCWRKTKEFDLIKTEAKATRKKEGIEKAKKTRAANKAAKDKAEAEIKNKIIKFYRSLTPSKQSDFRKMKYEDRIKYMNKNK